MSLTLKYSLASQITDTTQTEVKWLLPATLTLVDNSNYTFTSAIVTKGTPFIITIDSAYIVRYLAMSSDQSFSLSINNQQELITKNYAADFGIDSTGYTNISKIANIKITNPTGTRGPIGNQYSNPTTIDVKYLLVLEKIVV
jgi:hypothetical protein